MKSEPISGKLVKDRRIFEIMLIVLVLGTTGLYIKLGGYRSVALNLFFLPVVLGGFFLGRQNAGVLALLSGLTVTIASALDPTGFSSFTNPIMIGLAITVWAAVLGLTALLTGTLCDDRAKTVEELHKAYVGVVDVLSRYLQSANPRMKDRSIRIAELSQAAAAEIGLPRKQIDDIRVAALLHDLGSVEITTQLANRAISALQDDPDGGNQHTFQGSDLVQSLGAVLEGALPLVMHVDEELREYLVDLADPRVGETPLGAEIIRAARAYDQLATDGAHPRSPEEAFSELRRDAYELYNDEAVRALERVVLRRPAETMLQPLGA